MGIKILHFRPFRKNTLQGFLTVELMETGLQIRDVCLHEKNGSRWLAMPAKQYEDKEGNTQWMPLVKFKDRAISDNFQKQALMALEQFRPEATPETITEDDVPF